MIQFLLLGLWSIAKLLLIAYLAISVFHRAVRPAGFPLVGAGLAALIFNIPQGRELFFVLAENTSSSQYGMALWGAAGLLLLSVICWYTARRILYVPPDGVADSNAAWAVAARAWWPRIAATLPWVGAAAALASYPLDNAAWRWAVGLALACLAAAGALVWLLSRRGERLELGSQRFTPNADEAKVTWRWLIAGVTATVVITAVIWAYLGGWNEMLPIFSTYLGLFLVFSIPHQFWLRWSRWQRPVPSPAAGSREPIVHGPKVSWLVMGGLGLVWILATWLSSTHRPTAFGTLGLADFGALAIFCLGWSGIVLFFSALSFWVARDRHLSGAAVGASMLLWAFFLAGTALSDNHALWRGAAATQHQPRKSVEEHLRRWLLDRRASTDMGDNVDNPLPLVMIAAHGGGLRAAYWTGVTLALLEEKVQGFHCNVFAMATVSGSSLGALAWYATLAKQDSASYRCVLQNGAEIVTQVDKIIGHDFLASLIAGFLGPDLTGHFVPGGKVPDRQLYFESAWAGAASDTLTNGGQPIPFRDLIRPDPTTTEMPAVFFIAVDAHDGRRVIASDLAFNDVDKNLIKNAVDLFAHDQAIAISAITAAGASARFPWISPQGGIPGDSDVLDGGIFEATGAEVVHELLRGISGWCDTAARGVLRCTPGHAKHDRSDNIPSLPPGLCADKRKAHGDCVADADPIFVRPLALQLVNAPLDGPPRQRQLLASPELFGPVFALNAARGARGDAASMTVEGDPSLFAGAGFADTTTPYARFALDPERCAESVTLTWTLSDERLDHMLQEARSALALERNRMDDHQLVAWLRMLDGKPTDGSLPPDTPEDPCLPSRGIGKR